MLGLRKAQRLKRATGQSSVSNCLKVGENSEKEKGHYFLKDIIIPPIPATQL